ncbi:DUF3040 domain-containing protein [Amycolatopsis sp. 195334CR]|uniref:DUF3040 domain-containing protein n=1 Tax=Amycolatopsis sp. 195334CR TaxID=2814588 RepID=UPI001A8FCBF1|nr:DUF3040 domain-containing protein [Amycolatopsis sp. 195334CR]MBN6040635.1 DUF3040 domain-containing protein [Amycolatopsis sp. 195334CR]
MLSHDDREQLKKIEEWFEAAEPALAASFRRIGDRRRFRIGKVLPVCVDVLAGFLLTLAVITANATLVLAGMLALVIGVGLHLARHLPADQS